MAITDKLPKGKTTVMVVVGAIALGMLYSFSGSMFETNKAGYYQVRQAAVTGNMSVVSSPGMYMQAFAELFTYQISDMNYFSKHDIDGGSGVEAASIKVRFNDGGTADVSGSIKFKLSLTEADQLALHRDYKGYHSVQQDLVRQVVTEALMQSATLMKAEESYSTRRAEFASLAEDQVREGIFATESVEIQTKDVEGNEFIERSVKIKYAEDGVTPTIRKISPFRRYNIEVLQFVIKDIDFDQTIDALIAKKKEAEQQKVVARANAERAKQDAITAEEEGKARVAKAKADEEVEKIKAVTNAQKEYEVAELNKKKASAEADAERVRGEASAAIARLKVSAGLTPLERAQIQKDIAIGVAAELAKVQFPSMMIIGGSSDKGQGPLNPFDAVGLESFMRISKQMGQHAKVD